MTRMGDTINVPESSVPTEADFSELIAQMQDLTRLRQKAEEEAAKKRFEALESEHKQRLAWIEELSVKGLSDTQQQNIIKRDSELKLLADQERSQLRAARKLSGDARKAEEQRIKDEFKLKRANLSKLSKEEQKELDKRNKKQAAEAKKIAQEAWKSTERAIGGGLGQLLGPNKEQQAAMKAELEAEGKSEQEINDAMRNARIDAAAAALGEFAKQLAGTMKEVADTQPQIDTRLYGSKLEKKGNSYWKQMDWNIGANIGMSGYVKQADVVNNLKTLVGKGIAFNVEQRAFLETIKDKIATTFDAADATLLKLVRIQQADTTAGRLGMEAALNEFLNSMYATTEYMTEAASSIRQNLYEASALMGAEEATAFEFQVQKWMGSLHSVGFNNTTGLSEALGKLVAGDISSVTEGGYGNLLVMAATQANIPITKALNEGLNSDETNQLLEAVVSYLADIYKETQGSKVVAQQYANVFGINASDLKAAANLVESNKAIANYNYNYGGMLNNLVSMYSSMGDRVNLGTQFNNMLENLQYTIGASMGTNIVSAATYNIASMLDDVAGGIQIPAFSIMGNMVDLDTSVADLLRVVSVGGGLLGGIGKLLSGLGKGGNMLTAYGIDNNIKVLTRGDGVGLTPGVSKTQVNSETGYIGNEDGSDVQNKTINDANEDAQKDFDKKKEEYEQEETTLKVVDEHIVNIYNLLMTLSNNGYALKVTFGEQPVWSQVPNYSGGGGF